MPNDTPAERAWNYVTLGHGHDESFWRQFCAALTEVGYHDVLSIEQEDPTVDPSRPSATPSTSCIASAPRALAPCDGQWRGTTPARGRPLQGRP